MIVSILYRSNETLRLLCDFLLDKYPKMEIRELRINDNKYYQINIKTEEQKNIMNYINHRDAVLLCNDEEQVTKILKWNHVIYNNRGAVGAVREYKVFLVNLNPIVIFKREIEDEVKHKEGWVKVKGEGDKEVKKILGVSRRALQSIGLDFALIHITIAKLRKPVVVNIDPSPELSDKNIASLVSYIKWFIDGPKVNKTITIGADPEFVLFNKDNDKLVPASLFFPLAGSIGCDNVRIANQQQRPVAEFRPEYVTEPLALISNLSKVMAHAAELVPYKNIKWYAGSSPVKGYPLGGHIHFGNVTPTSHMLRALDNYLAIPVLMLENSEKGRLRRTKYGTLSDYRLKEYGGFEYRTLPSWLFSPEITTGVLIISWLIVNNYLLLNDNVFTREEAHLAFYQGKKEYFRSHMSRIWDAIMNLPEADKYMTYINPLYERCINLIEWDEYTDIRQNWEISIGNKKYREGNQSKKKGSSTRVTVRMR